jgi:hypothetical protein
VRATLLMRLRASQVQAVAGTTAHRSPRMQSSAGPGLAPEQQQTSTNGRRRAASAGRLRPPSTAPGAAITSNTVATASGAASGQLQPGGVEIAAFVPRGRNAREAARSVGGVTDPAAAAKVVAHVRASVGE